MTRPMPCVLPVRKRRRAPGLTSSGCCTKRKRHEAVSLVPMRLDGRLMPSMTAVWRTLPRCTVVWKPTWMLVEWNSTTTCTDPDVVHKQRGRGRAKLKRERGREGERTVAWKKSEPRGLRWAAARIMPLRRCGVSVSSASEALWPARTLRHDDL